MTNTNSSTQTNTTTVAVKPYFKQIAEDAGLDINTGLDLTMTPDERIASADFMNNAESKQYIESLTPWNEIPMEIAVFQGDRRVRPAIGTFAMAAAGPNTGYGIYHEDGRFDLLGDSFAEAFGSDLSMDAGI